MLGVTVSMDVMIVILFAVAVAVASALLTGVGFNATFALLLLADLGLAIVAGILAGLLLKGILATPFTRRSRWVLFWHWAMLSLPDHIC